MADTDPAPSENGAFWNSTREGFVFFGSREAETSTSTAATNRRSPVLAVRDVSLNRLDLWERPDEMESDRASQSGRRPSIERVALDLQDEWEVDSDGESFIEDDETDIEDQSTPLPWTAAKYLSGLQPVPVNDLPGDCRTCCICQEIYNTGDEQEQACLVGRCEHVLGRTCLSTWVMPEGRKPNNTCPLCRAVLFEDDTSGPTNAFDRDIERLREIIGRLGETIEEPRNDNGQRILDLQAQIEDERYALAFSDAIASMRASETRQHLVDRQARFEDDRFALAYLESIACVEASEVWDRVRDNQHDRAGAGIARPPYLFSEYVLTFFRRYIHLSDVGSAAIILVSPALNISMGLLYERLRRDMERTAMPIVWTENGPPLSWFLDPAAIQLIEITLERLVDIERQCASPLPLRPIFVRFPDII